LRKTKFLRPSQRSRAAVPLCHSELAEESLRLHGPSAFCLLNVVALKWLYMNRLAHLTGAILAPVWCAKLLNVSLLSATLLRVFILVRKPVRRS